MSDYSTTGTDIPRSASQDTLHSQLPPQPPKALSPNRRAVEVLRQAIQAKEILPMAKDSPWTREVASGSTVCTSSLLVRNKEQYLQWYAKGWYDKVYSRTVEDHQLIEAGNFIISDATTEYKLMKSPRVFRSRWLLIYEFESPRSTLIPSLSGTGNRTIRRIKGMSHSAKVIQDSILATADDEIENGRWKARSRP
ncbi:hypothetical protein BDP27DRAFT_1436286 [Rhodocollybia butyracea]|uniref:Uncharacterized protein n=1 Tax=Rhodocollybia butyracea TaxID=206335 RepID=A0A9P5P415_9AGAR|nr:hypothetical protein BDP27DRAFT_1436286 [Rhodocollybia butyracea]